MGIPAYFSFLVKNYAGVLRKFEFVDQPINNLYLDANSIIYDAIRSTDFTSLTISQVQHIVNEVIRKITNYVNDIKPNKTLMIAFDGVAPVAKLEQQRQRRFKSQYQIQINRTVYKNLKLDPFNTTAITPGTVFMKELNKGIRNYFVNPSNLNLETIVLSLSDVAGEGEHKIFNFIRSEPSKHSSEHTVIYGLDADLIMLSLNHLHICPNLYLFRETPEFIKSVSADLEPNELYNLDIQTLERAICDQMCGDGAVNKSKIFDYIFICFFLGNDFMPHFPALNIRTGGVDKVVNAYKASVKADQTIVYVNEEGKHCFHWAVLREFVGFLARLEEQYFLDETEIRDKMSRKYYPTTTPEEKMKKFESLPILSREKELKIKPHINGWQQRYYQHLLHMDGDVTESISQNFLEMLVWTFHYYSKGCTDWRFKYNFAYPPLLQDLYKAIPSRDGDFFESTIDASKNQPIKELTQLCYVLPRNCLYLLPFNLEKTLTDHFDHLYVNKCTFTWAYCRYFWECHADLPPVDISELELFLSRHHK
jgi:5'-3' exonuclease